MIRIHNYEKVIQGNTVLDHINLELVRGKVYGLQGKNGSGKTMLLRAVSGLITPTNGYIEIEGETLGREITFPESIGVLIENPAFIPYYTGFKNLKILADIRGEIGHSEIEDIIRKVGLDPKEKKVFRKYSLGMKQRLGIACAFMENPDIILLDEPTNALDRDGVQMVRKLLDEAKSRGAVVVTACHDRRELELIADEIIMMENGRILKDNYEENNE